METNERLQRAEMCMNLTNTVLDKRNQMRGLYNFTFEFYIKFIIYKIIYNI